MVSDVPEFYYVTPYIMYCPPLDGLESSEIYAFDPEYESLLTGPDLVKKLKMMVVSDSNAGTVHSQVLDKVATYMNRAHRSNYTVYNLFRDR